MDEEKWKVYWIQITKERTEAKSLWTISTNEKETLHIFAENPNT